MESVVEFITFNVKTLRSDYMITESTSTKCVDVNDYSNEKLAKEISIECKVVSGLKELKAVNISLTYLTKKIMLMVLMFLTLNNFVLVWVEKYIILNEMFIKCTLNIQKKIFFATRISYTSVVLANLNFSSEKSTC